MVRKLHFPSDVGHAELLQRLAAFERAAFPVISLYLDARPDQHGRDHFEPWLRKELASRAKSLPPRSAERESFDKDVQRIDEYLKGERRPSTNSIVIFACAAAGFFEALQLDAPIAAHHLYVSHQPCAYDLALIDEEYRPYAVLLADTNTARLLICRLGGITEEHRLQDPKISRTAAGGWSQARYQRHVDNYHLHHAKNIIQALEGVAREDNIAYVLVAGDDVILPLLRDEIPSSLKKKMIEVSHLDVKSPQQEILRTTLEAVRRQDAKDDAEKVRRLLEERLARGAAVAGPRETLAALERGQVDELILSASLPRNEVAEYPDLPNQLVAKAVQTTAQMTFVEDAALLKGVAGVGALLRWPAQRLQESL